MSFEFQALFGATAILLVLVIIQGSLIPLTHGFKWGLGPRDEPRDPSVMLGRLKRILANHMEAMAMFTPLVVIAHLIGVSTPLTIWGAALFIAARAGFAVIYFLGVPVLRSAAWGVGFAGLLMIGFEIFKAGF